MAQTEQFPPKDVQCKCGNVLTIEKRSDWCTKCARKVFYHKKDRRWNKINNIYLGITVIGIMSFLAYVFIKLILIPVSKL